MAADAPVSSSPAWQRGLVARWLVSVEHRRIGILYLGTAGFFLLLAGLVAVLMRIQLIGPDVDMIGQRTYLGMTSFHGIAMVFFFALPLVLGLANAIVPLQAGARRDAYPRINAVAFWVFLFGGLCVALSPLAKGGSAGAGWTSYPPFSLATGGNGHDLVLMGLILASAAALATVVNLVVTVRHHAAPGMTWHTLPVFAKSLVVLVAGLLVAVPLQIAGCVFLLLAREWPSAFDFFVTTDGDAPVLRSGWIWLFGQPVAYLLLVPVLGIVAEIASTFTRGRFRGGRILVTSLLAFTALVVLTWLHHTYSTGTGDKPSTVLLVLAVLALLPIAAAVAAIAQSGLLSPATLSEPAAQFAVGALVLLVLGGLSGLFLAIWGNDRGLRGTAFATGHAHYLLFGPALFALLGGLVYWWPKLFGRILDRKLVGGAFALLFCGFVISFLLQFVVGDKGVARRVSSYEGVEGVEALQVVSSIFAFVAAIGVLALVGAVAMSRRARRAGNDPWQGDTLEWFTASPPPRGNFDSLPPVTSDRPLADLRRTLREQGAL